MTPAPASTPTSYKVTSTSTRTLRCGTEYLFRVSAIGDGMAHNGITYSSFSFGDTSDPLDPSAAAKTDFFCTPQGLNVIPLAQRHARLSWEPVANAEQYFVEVQQGTSGGWGNFATVSTIPPATVPTPSVPIKLDSILSSGEGLAHAATYQFQVRAAVRGGHLTDNAFSETVTLIDTPILSVNGASSMTVGQMLVKWKWAGNDAQYTIRYRELPGNHRQVAIQGTPGWQPTPAANAMAFSTVLHPTPTVTVVPGPTPTITLEYPITGLNLRDSIYAVQLNYTIGTDKYFSAREAYVWPSDGQPAADKRVATYPFAGYLSSRTYTYRVCASTFNETNVAVQNAWARLFEHALEQWEKATGGFITMTPDYENPSAADPVYKPCTDYATPTPVPGAPTPIPTSAAALINKPWFRDIVSKDNQLNEIRAVDPPSFLDIQAGSLFELIVVADPLKTCILLPGAAACATSSPPYGSALQNISASSFYEYIIPAYGRLPLAAANTELASGDIIFNRDVLIPPTPTPTVAPNIPKEVVFNTCVRDSMPPMPDPNDNSVAQYFWAYATAVHEAGHVLGLAGRPQPNEILSLIFVPYEVAHPTTPGAVMNYDQRTMVSEPDCAPHPLDVLAIFALYQSAPPP